MAQILQPETPTRLYRYRGFARSDEAIDQEISAITENYIWCANFVDMNDPMEGFFRSSKLLREHDNHRQIVRNITDSKTNIGIACLSETYDNSLMWAHYAGNYGGICIEYSTKGLLSGMDHDVNLVRLAYVDQPLLVYPSVARNAKNAARSILSQKRYNWAYEREWRVLGHVGRVTLGDEVPIRSIMLGSRISTRHRRRVLDAAGDLRIPVDEMDIDGYDHVWDKVSPTNCDTAKKSKRRV